ncbi:DUF2029 domain-containing protein [Roseibium denhamense]|uniref:DUF2029 domain-containing protein n=1 Tax=Roseibium denhamense TaxID=76305 RepID=A0ABY1P2I4_9HYPH|nr:glycosyltransferase family 87 protein [Roseibium denhamense]MTI07682.1 DUF2029 domain-containing protein [Roseibium denhamense]SMP24477.1 Protein of unknown function [Roseibium denhamense]
MNTDIQETGQIEPSHGRSGLWDRAVRRAEWLTWDRIRIACVFSAIGMVLGLAYLLLLPNAQTSPTGLLIMDYLAYWLAGQQALNGTPGVVYDTFVFLEMQRTMSGTEDFLTFFYPPPFQMMLMPFALLPYKAAFVVFAATTTVFLAFVCRLITGNWVWAICLILIPASFNNVFHGQNAALTAALFGLFALGIDRGKYWWAGIALGLLTIKPQLGILAPFALIACWNWRAFAGASATALVLAGLSVLVLGSNVWVLFWTQAPLATDIMNAGNIDWAKMVSVYSSVRQLGVGHSAAMGVQALTGIAMLVCVWLVWSRSADTFARTAVLAAGTLLSTPYAHSYDVLVLVVPCAFLIVTGTAKGFLDYEKAGLAIVIGLAASTASIAILSGVPIAPLLPALMVWMGMRRGLGGASVKSPAYAGVPGG